MEEETSGGDSCWSFADGSGEECFLPFPCYRCGVVLGDAAGDVGEHEHDVAGDL